jgi:hypothetical protein
VLLLKKKHFKGVRMSVSDFVVVDNGSINVNKSVKKFSEELAKYKEANQSALDKVSVTVNEFFDSHKKTVISKPNLIDRITFMMMPDDVDNFSSVKKTIVEFINSSIGTKESGSLLRMKKGVGGGISRWSDFEE